MAKFLYTLLIAFSCSYLNAQITVSPNPLVMKTNTVDSLLKFYMNFTNSKDTTYNIYWMLSPAADWPVEWEFQLCDLNLCYATGGKKSSNGIPNIFPKGTHEFYINLNTRGVIGSSTITIKLFTEKDCQGEIFSAPIATENVRPSGTSDLNESLISLSPNPTLENFQINNGSKVTYIELYDMMGQKIKSASNTIDTPHDVADLKNGVYFVKMYDQNKTAVKTEKLTKVGNAY
jgi:hypothetical protein